MQDSDHENYKLRKVQDSAAGNAVLEGTNSCRSLSAIQMALQKSKLHLTRDPEASDEDSFGKTYGMSCIALLLRLDP